MPDVNDNERMDDECPECGSDQTAFFEESEGGEPDEIYPAYHECNECLHVWDAEYDPGAYIDYCYDRGR